MKEYHFFVAATENYQKILKILFLSLRRGKGENSKFITHLYLDTNRLTYFREAFQPITNENFVINVQSSLPYKNLIDASSTKMNYTDYVRCLAPKLFPQLDRITILDCDLVINQKGLEEFLDEDIDDYYANAVIDIPIDYKESKLTVEGKHYYNYQEKKQCKTKKYFNLGLCQLNLKKIRQDGKDLELLEAAIKFPEKLERKFNAQTIYNYVLRNKVKISDIKFNNTILTMHKADMRHMLTAFKDYNYENENDLITKTIIFHFAGPKPWEDLILEKVKQHHPFFQFAIGTWKEFERYFKDEL